MSIKHDGTVEELAHIVEGCGFNISQQKEDDNNVQIRTTEGAIVNWYPSTGTVVFQGKKDPKDKLIRSWGDYTGKIADHNKSENIKAPEAPINPATAHKKVFVVHGHDEQSREQLELVLHKLGMDPFVLANTSGGGLTIIEALEKEIGPKSDQARFGIVLLTPDDMAYSKSSKPEEAEPRARQNVILEMGMLIAAVGRGNVAILKKGHLEVPSDASGILYIPYNDHVKEVVPKLTDRLRNSGFVLSPEAITKASS